MAAGIKETKGEFPEEIWRSSYDAPGEEDHTREYRMKSTGKEKINNDGKVNQRH